MSQPDNDIIQQAQVLISAGQLPKAQRLLVAYIKQNSNSEEAWYTLSTAVEDPNKQIECLQRVLRLNPGNTAAQSRLMRIMAKPAEPETPPPPPAPSPDEPAAPLPPIGMAATPIETPEPEPAAAPEAAPVAAPSAAVAPITDTELSSLRSSMKFIKPRAPRRRGLRILLLFLLVLLAAAGGSYLIMNSLRAAPAADVTPETNAVASAATATPTLTATPTITPTPSVTPVRFPPTWTPTPPPTPLPTRTSTPLPTLNADVAAQLSALRDQVAAIRGVSIFGDKPAILLPLDEYQQALQSILNLQDLFPYLKNQGRVLTALGLVAPAQDLTLYTLNDFADSAGGFYVPWQDVIYVMGKAWGGVERQAFTQEYARAIVDDAFNINQLGIYPQCQMDGQRCQAIRALLAGDAALVAEQRFKKDATAEDKKDLAKFQQPALAFPDVEASAYLTRDVTFAPEQGTQFVRALYQRGGWDAVNNALTNLPDSTEQILHPEKYLAGEKPITVTATPLTDTLGGSWELIANDSLGEWRTYLLLSAGEQESTRLSDETARQAAAGWGGDRYEVYLAPQTNQTLLAAQWVWDTPQDAAEFKQAMSAYLDLRFRGVKAQTPGQECWSAKGQITCLYTSAENSLLWLLGPDLATIESVHNAYSNF